MTRAPLLFIGHLWPEPTSSAAGYRTLALLKAIAQAQTEDQSPCWQLHFACAAEKTEYCADLDAHGIISHTILLNDSSFDRLVDSLQPQIVIYDRFITEEQFAPRVHHQCPQAINILDTQDLHFLRRARQKALTSGQTLTLHSDDSIREIGAILRADLSLIISSYEMRLLTDTFQVAPELLHYCPFMIAANKTTPHSLRSYEEREHFVMIGNFLHPPNWDAVLWCYQSIWPLIREKLPHAQLHVYGAYPSEKVWQLHQPDKGFYIKGRADDAIETLSHYRVNLAPLRFGAGIKGKIADGFIAHTPCVTTEIGCEGMADNLPWGGLVVDLSLTIENNRLDNEQLIAQSAVNLYQDPSLWEQCNHNGQQIISQQFDESSHAQAFILRLLDIRTNILQHRKNNFYGQILRHQLYRSQYFMSKWIEEKNAPKS